MLSGDDLAEAEGVATWILRRAGVDPDDAVSTRAVARGLGISVRRERQLARGSIVYLRGEARIYVHPRLTPQREEWVIGHELGHWARPEVERSEHEERMCDAIGAALVAPRAAVARIARQIGHRVHAVAELLHVEQSLALLRIGEVTGRSVILLRSPAIARGDAFEWGETPRALPRSIAHPIRVDGRWGMMAA